MIATLKKYLVLLSCFLFVIGQAQVTKKVLFIGDYYTLHNTVPWVLDSLANNNNHDIIWDENAGSILTLMEHSTDAITLNKIKAEDWDYVVIQAGRLEAAYSPAQLALYTYPYADSLNQKILENNSCTEPLFYMTWADKDGYAWNCASYPPMCTFEGMQQKLKDSYIQMANDNDGTIAPVGVAWKAVRDSFPSIELYDTTILGNDRFSSVQGAYLAACVFYCTIFRESVVGNSYESNLDSLTAYRLQDFATKTILDSSWVWRIGLNDQFIELPEDTILCADSLTIGVSGLYYDLEWSNGDSTSSITIDSSGLYYATITNNRSCQEVDSMFVNLNISGIDSIFYEACDSFDFEGQFFYEDTVIVRSFTTSVNCDSLFFVKIDIKREPHLSFNYQGISIGAYDVLVKIESEEHWDSIFIVYEDQYGAGTFNSADSLYFVANVYGYALAWNDCGMDSLDFSVIYWSIQELDNSWNLAPNPATDLLQISNEDNQGFGYKIYNFLGQAVIEEKYQDLSYRKIPLDKLSKGNYFIVLTDKDRASIGRRTIQKR